MEFLTELAKIAAMVVVAAFAVAVGLVLPVAFVLWLTERRQRPKWEKRMAEHEQFKANIRERMDRMRRRMGE